MIEISFPKITRLSCQPEWQWHHPVPAWRKTSYRRICDMAIDQIEGYDDINMSEFVK